MDYATFCLGALYIVLAAMEAWRFLKKSGIAATLERFKEGIMVGIGSLYMLHSGLFEVMLGQVASGH